MTAGMSVLSGVRFPIGKPDKPDIVGPSGNVRFGQNRTGGQATKVWWREEGQAMRSPAARPLKLLHHRLQLVPLWRVLCWAQCTEIAPSNMSNAELR